jgi:hypothetical protein
MCPVCIATAAWIAVGATGTGGLSLLIASRLRTRHFEATTNHNNNEKGERHG